MRTSPRCASQLARAHDTSFLRRNSPEAYRPQILVLSVPQNTSVATGNGRFGSKGDSLFTVACLLSPGADMAVRVSPLVQQICTLTRSARRTRCRSSVQRMRPANVTTYLSAAEPSGGSGPPRATTTPRIYAPTTVIDGP